MQLKTFVLVCAIIFLCFIIFLRKSDIPVRYRPLTDKLKSRKVLSTCMGEPISAWARDMAERLLQSAERSGNAYKRSTRNWERLPGSSFEEMEMSRIYEDEPQPHQGMNKKR